MCLTVFKYGASWTSVFGIFTLVSPVSTSQKDVAVT